MIYKPSPAVLKAFNASQNPVRLTGGQGQAWRSGKIVLKSAADTEETNWIANFYLSTQCNGFRLPKPILTTNGRFVYENWQAWEYLEGFHKNDCWEEVIEVCNFFHKSIADLPKPKYFGNREQNPWVIADKVAWDELELEHHPKILPFINHLRKFLKPLNCKDQLIHGDFGGNVLFSRNNDPAVIDFSPYWRPAEFAVGVVIADAIVWENAEISLIDKNYSDRESLQYLIRAELRRVIELDTLYNLYGINILDQIDAHQNLIDEICARVK